MRKLALGLAVSLLSSTALAAPKKAPVQAPPPEIAGLDADDAVIVRESIESLGMLGTPAAAEAIAARLSRGLPRDLTLVALDALGILQQRVAVPVVEKLTRHRDETIRLRALQTLVALDAPLLRGTLERGLDDPSAEVRAECVQALVRHGHRSSVPVLFRALDAGELGAALPIAVHGDDAAVRRLSSYLGRVPFTAMAEPMARALAREDLERRLRLDLVGRLVELATPEIKYFLEDLAGTLPGPSNDPVKRAVSDAAFRIVD